MATYSEYEQRMLDIKSGQELDRINERRKNMPVYTVSKGGRLLLDDFRGDRLYGEVYNVKKDGKPAYEVVSSTLGSWCNCPGFTNHSRCKHMAMVYDFMQKEGD